MLVFDQMKKGDRPLWWLTVTISAGILILVGGLWYHQVYASSRYVESQKTQSFRRVRYPALRGQITDRNGAPLAENRACYNVNLYLEELSGRFQEAWRVAKTQADRERTRAGEDPRNTNSPPLGWFQRLFRKAKGGKPKWTPEELAILGKQVRFAVVTNLVFELGKRMGQTLSPPDEKKFQDHYASRLVVPLPVMEDLTAQQVALFCEMPNKPPGLNLDLQPLRKYPFKTGA
jgi:penicillin-binding protein 2